MKVLACKKCDTVFEETKSTADFKVCLNCMHIKVSKRKEVKKINKERVFLEKFLEHLNKITWK